MTNKPAHGLHRPAFEKDGCGFGLIAHMDGRASHALVRTAISSLGRLTHRGAVAADGKTGDGCGLLMKLPIAHLRARADAAGIALTERFGVGAVFLSPQKAAAARARAALDAALTAAGLAPAGWRETPVNTAACGADALRSMPRIEQCFVNTELRDGDEFERRLFVARKRAEQAVGADGNGGADGDFYIASLSGRLLSYKGLVMPEYLPMFYEDLGDPALESALCVFHQRFSTNTDPQWRLAQPFRYLAHNGEINTIRGNRNWAAARAHVLRSPQLPPFAELAPLVSMEGSDSCSLDNMLEALMLGGMDIFQAMRLLIPPAWQNVGHFDPDLRAFYEYAAMHMEAWDGPAGIVLTDGRYAACVMDRNGLRPARYVITKDRHITLASEVGVHDYAPEDIAAKGRLKPGEMIAADTRTGELLLPADLDARLKSAHPCRTWLKDGARHLRREPAAAKPETLPPRDLAVHENMFGVTREEEDQIIRVLAENGQEAVGSMGDDTPLPPLSTRTRALFDCFRQQFAQVTNPPIDPLRERIVMSLETCLGPQLNPLEMTAEHARRVVLESPTLSAPQMRRMLKLEAHFKARRFDLNIDREQDYAEALAALCDQAVAAVRDEQACLIVLSDRDLRRNALPLHALLACGAVHQRLVREGLRCAANIIVETGWARDPHHMAALIGNGATAVHPYLAEQIVLRMAREGTLARAPSERAALSHYHAGLDKGLYKIISKMGISTIASYRGAQLFEIIGLADEVVELCFTGTPSRLQGANFAKLREQQARLAWRAWSPGRKLEQGGLLKYVHGGEYHAYNPDVVRSLHQAVRSGDYADYQVFADHVNGRPPSFFRDLLRLRPAAEPIALDEVEPVEAILPRFNSAGMSLGALSPEAHEVLAEAMSRLGARSNSGEGGEDPARYGTIKSSKIKQVASGRFGVTPHYLRNAEALQIKIAQGAKPGEGGQLPGHKVNATIAKLRYAKEGISLISPPPHHDIYSIEDLAQLIFDLKQVNPEALVSVKLVAAPGVGTIAVGVAKAYADLITISGYDGGTGASPLTSVKYAGGPWELGLPEAHQALRANNLRDKVVLQTDGGLKTGLDVIKAALLGAESFGFGTAPMIAMGCKYLRICHLNNCATGVATQHQVLRKLHFVGTVEMVMNYFRFVAEETRAWLAQLGARSIEELIGRAELLAPDHERAPAGLDLAPILSDGGAPAERPHFCKTPGNPSFDQGELAERMVADMRDAIEHKRGGDFRYEIRNFNRSIGARVAGEIAARHGSRGLHDAPVTARFAGTAGQSFGAWNIEGLRLRLEGDANDYVGKGMAGGEIIINPPPGAAYASRDTVIIGNTCLYGATGGRLFAAGLAGERFAVRNSGATAVVEGVGDHGCEYMTGGLIVVLGPTGINFGAGMTGGFALVLDRDNNFSDCYNHELVEIQRIDTEETLPQRDYLHALLAQYARQTKSAWGKEILDDFGAFAPAFWLVKPKVVELAALLDHLMAAA